MWLSVYSGNSSHVYFFLVSTIKSFKKFRLDRTSKMEHNETWQYIRTSLLNGDFVLAFERKRFFSTAHMTFVVNSSSYKVSIYIMCHSGRFAQNVDDNNYHTLILLVIKRQIRSPFNWFSTTLLQTANFLRKSFLSKARTKLSKEVRIYCPLYDVLLLVIFILSILCFPNIAWSIQIVILISSSKYLIW
jgi:hypothetical protein